MAVAPVALYTKDGRVIKGRKWERDSPDSDRWYLLDRYCYPGVSVWLSPHGVTHLRTQAYRVYMRASSGKFIATEDSFGLATAKDIGVQVAQSREWLAAVGCEKMFDAHPPRVEGCNHDSAL